MVVIETKLGFVIVALQLASVEFTKSVTSLVPGALYVIPGGLQPLKLKGTPLGNTQLHVVGNGLLTDTELKKFTVCGAVQFVGFAEVKLTVVAGWTVRKAVFVLKATHPLESVAMSVVLYVPGVLAVIEGDTPVAAGILPGANVQVASTIEAAPAGVVIEREGEKGTHPAALEVVKSGSGSGKSST